MTDKDIIKALMCCHQVNGCERCPLRNDTDECEILNTYALDFLLRQKAEIERLQKRLDLAEQCISEVEDAAYRGGSNDYIDSAIDRYNNLVKEMTEHEGK